MSKIDAGIARARAAMGCRSMFPQRSLHCALEVVADVAHIALAFEVRAAECLWIAAHAMVLNMCSSVRFVRVGTPKSYSMGALDAKLPGRPLGGHSDGC